MDKKYLNVNVYDAAKDRIAKTILDHDDYLVSFSGGKDSGVLVYLVIEVAKELNRLPVKVVFSDLESIFKETERYTKHIMGLPEVEPYWLCLEEIDDNPTSVYQRYWRFWDAELDDSKWCRDMPKMNYVINNNNIPPWLKKYYTKDLDEWTITKFGEALCDKNNTTNIVQFIGCRTSESYGRLMNIRVTKNRIKKNNYTYQYKHKLNRTWISQPIYDWEVSDIWHYYYKFNKPYNRVYDSMYKLGISPSQQRTCCAFGEEQRKSLWQWSLIEPDTWDRMVYRVCGINFGKYYNSTNLNRAKVKKPNSITWKEYTYILLNTIPKESRDIFKDKFDIVFRYHKTMYGIKEGIPSSVYIQDSRKDVKEKMKETGLSIKYFISWESLASAIIKRDYVFKKYGFGYSNKMCKTIENLEKKYREEL